MLIIYTPRILIKWSSDFMDRDEIGAAYDAENDELRICPPDLSSIDLNVITDRWLTFFRVASEFRNFEFGELWFGNDLHREGFHLAATKFLEEADTHDPQFIEILRAVMLCA